MNGQSPQTTDEVITVENRFYILASSPSVDDRTWVLKEGDTFAVFDRYGDIRAMGKKDQGLYHKGTRFLSQFLFRLAGFRPLLLSSAVGSNNAFLAVDFTNPDIHHEGQITVPRGTIHFFRNQFLWKGVLYQRLRIFNHSQSAIVVPLSFKYDADFVDIFEVRGMERSRRGNKIPDRIDSHSVRLAYHGLDEQTRFALITAQPKPERIADSEIVFGESLEPHKEMTIDITIQCDPQQGAVIDDFDKAFAQSSGVFKAEMKKDCHLTTSNEQFNDWLERCHVDLHMMLTETPHGLYPYAGVPWYSTVFGRDGIITALEYLWLNPNVAKGVLGYLAATQATEVNSDQDAEPGKIIHETREGEMANLGEIPFGRYYGSVDATPLFVVLAGAYYERTGDRAFIEKLWPHIQLALDWMDNYGDADHDGFVEYSRRSSNGLIQQGWKDSHDSVFHEDGSFAEGPIALCEVQGYVYDAKRKAALMASLIGKSEMAVRLSQEARVLQKKFQKTFWLEDKQTYALALDGQKNPCRVRSSNAGHCLYSEISSSEQARAVAHTLFEEGSFSGWGIRTLDGREVRYNPMSYHNGSVWPHDNAMIAAGLAKYGFKQLVVKLLRSLYEAGLFLDSRRMPELFCGFHRRANQGPTLYPVACAPQAWSAASGCMIIQALLGLSIDGPGRQVQFYRPTLPDFLDELIIKNLQIDSSSIDLRLTRAGSGVSFDILRQEENVMLKVVK